MTKIAVIFLAIAILGLSQILRVRLLNVLVEPHFTVGLRSGIFMNSIGSFLNIITPFRLGEIYRYSFMRKRYQSNRAIILNALAIERVMDAGILIFVVVSLYGLNTLNILWLQTTFFILLLLGYITFYVFADQFSERTKNSSLVKQIIHLAKVRFKEVIILFYFIWITYILAGLLVVLVYSEDFWGWLSWNVSSFRLINFASGEINLFQKYNIIFVLTFLFFGLVISFLGHQSNRSLDLLTGSRSDSLTRDYMETVLRQGGKRDLFLAAPISKYWCEVKKSDLCVEIYTGGSGALVFSLRSDPHVLRKVAFGRQKSRLIEQYDFLNKFSENWRFPNIDNPIFGKDYFSFDMEKIHPAKTLYETLVLCDESTDIEAYVNQIHQFIDGANSSVGLIYQSDLRINTEAFWGKKLQPILDHTKLQLPGLFFSQTIDINGRSFKGLDVVFEEIRKLAFKVPGLSSLSAPHGDSSLSNLLIVESNLQIRGIDPNPNQIVKNISVDHGKVLQSLMGQYEGLMASGELLETKLGSVVYSQTMSSSIEVASELYMQLLAADSDVFIHSQIMCFASMMRLLPYRLEQDSKSAPIFAARTIELGNRILGVIR